MRALVLLLVVGCTAAPRVRTETPADVPDVPVDTVEDVDTPDDAVEVDDVQDIPQEVDGGDETSPWNDPGPIGPDEGPPVGSGGVGEACFKDDQCNGDGLCLDWLDGYCTFLNCPIVFECPEGTGCVDLGGGTTICLNLCQDQDSCRQGYGCKSFVTVSDEVLQGCVGLNDEPGPAGGTCDEHSDCEASLACLTFVPEGYCALIGCDAESCPIGTSCVTYNGQPTCLAACQKDEECLIGDATGRTCSPLLDQNLKVAKVCIPSVDGDGVGSQCSTDIECESNECVIVAEGKCVGSDLGCFTDDDCPGAGVCELAPAYVKGVCTQACAPDIGCPGQSLCIDSAQGPAFCQVPCSGSSDQVTCDSSLGENCVFGDPLAGVGTGSYACVVTKAGDPGMDCTSPEDCKETAPCQLGTGDTGTCVPDCSDTLECPFPTVCIEHDAALRCMKRCFSIQDCPGTLQCKVTPTSFTKICVP